MGPPRVVLFDLFGTLIDESSERDGLEATLAAVRDRFEIGERADDLAGEYAVALMDRVMEERDLPREGPIAPFEVAARDALDDLLAKRGLLASDEDRAWFWRTLMAKTRRHARAFPDAEPALASAAAAAGHVGVLTDADPALAQLVLEATGLARHVAAVTSGMEAGAFKPDPQPFLAALAKAGAPAREAAMVGDSWERDVEPALALGMRGVLLDRHAARTVAAPVKVRSLAEIRWT